MSENQNATEDSLRNMTDEEFNDFLKNNDLDSSEKDEESGEEQEQEQNQNQDKNEDEESESGEEPQKEQEQEQEQNELENQNQNEDEGKDEGEEQENEDVESNQQKEEKVNADEDDSKRSEESESSDGNNDVYHVKFKGKEFDINKNEEDTIKTLLQKGMNHDFILQTHRKHKPIINLLEKNNLSEEDLILYIDAKNGDKSAFAKLAESMGISEDELFEDSESFDGNKYTPKTQTLDVKEIEIEESLASIEEENRDKIIGLYDNLEQTNKVDFWNNAPYLIQKMNNNINLVDENQNNLHDFIISTIEKERILGKNLNKTFVENYDNIENIVLSRMNSIKNEKNSKNDNTINEKGNKPKPENKNKFVTPKGGMNNSSNQNTSKQQFYSEEELSRMDDTEFNKAERNSFIKPV